MKTQAYSEKLKDPRWQRKRLEILNRDNFTCLECEGTKSTLHVHHLFYVSGRDPWMYPNWSLGTLCKKCHDERHNYEWGETETPEWESLVGYFFGGMFIDDRDGSDLWDGVIECSKLQQEIGYYEFASWIARAARAERLDAINEKEASLKA